MKQFKSFFIIATLVTSLFVLNNVAFAQLPSLPKIPKDVTEKIPDLGKMTEGEPPITSSIKDAVTGISFLDDFDPPVFIPMTVLPRTTQGAFILERPGLYAFTAKSYCLKAGTYAPTTGDGYILAPLAGPKSAPVRRLLHATYTHPEITQREIQVLLWAIIARTKISDMPRDYQVTAAKVLSPKDIFELNNGALGLVPEDMMDEAFRGVSPAVRTILEAEARLRTKMTQGETSYEELEEIAVRFGAAPAGEDDEYIPWGRWSFHPDGYFIRFLPRGYTSNNIQVYVPRDCLIEKDNLGRITAVCDRNSQRIEIEYAGNPNPLVIAGDRQVRACKFKRVRFINRMTIPPEMTTELVADWENTGYTLVGTPSGKGKPSYNAAYPGLEDRYEKVTASLEDIDRIDQHLKIQGSTSDLINLTHLRHALLSIVENDHSGGHAWARYHVDLVSRVWQYEFSRRAGTFVWGQNSDESKNPLRTLFGYIERFLYPWSFANAAANGKPTLDNTGNSSMPGSTGKQRGGNSNAGKADPCAQVQQALEFAKNVKQAYENVDPSKYPDGDAYNDAVIDELNNILNKNGQASADPSSPENAPMGTHPTNCDLAPGGTSSAYDGDWAVYDNSTTQMFEDHIRNTRFSSGPDILWRGARAHEQVHMNTCRDKTSGGNKNGYKDYMDDPANRQKDEVAAYDAQIAKLQAWLDWNCK